MQKMTNVLLASKDSSSEQFAVGEIKPSGKSESKSSQGDDFSSVLEQVNVKSNQSGQSKSSSPEQAQQNDKQPIDAEGGDIAIEDVAEDNPTADINHLLAQINLASELDNKDLEGASGDTLPLESEKGTQEPNTAGLDEILLAASEQKEAVEPSFDDDAATLNGLLTAGIDENSLLDPETGEVIDSQLLNSLIQQTGLSERELNQLPPEALTELIAMVRDPNVQLMQAESQISGGGKVGEQANLANAADKKNTADTTNPSNPSASMAQLNPQASLAGDQVSKSAGVQVDEGKLAFQEAGKAQLSGQQLDLSQQGKSSQVQNILGEKSLSEAAPKVEVSSKVAMAANAQAEQQLKGADLSVKLTTVGSFDVAASQSESSSVTDIKTLQSAPLGANTQAKPDIAQFQLALRQSNEQQNTMQEMIQRFSPVMKQQLITMVSQGIQHAEIRLDPPELGQLMVRIQVQGDQTQVQFQVAQHQTRDIVEQALPRLKEMLAEQGMQLTDSHVSQQDSGNNQGEGDGSEHSQASYDSELDELSADDPLLSSNQATSYRSGIDYYA